MMYIQALSCVPASNEQSIGVRSWHSSKDFGQSGQAYG